MFTEGISRWRVDASPRASRTTSPISAAATSTVHRKQSAISPVPMCIPPICAIMAPPNVIIPSAANRGIGVILSIKLVQIPGQAMRLRRSRRSAWAAWSSPAPWTFVDTPTGCATPVRRSRFGSVVGRRRQRRVTRNVGSSLHWQPTIFSFPSSSSDETVRVLCAVFYRF